MNESKLRAKIGWEPHKCQLEILKSDSQDIVICAGRRFGKSALCAYVALKTVLEGDLLKSPKIVWIVSPSYDLSNRVFEYLTKWYLKVNPEGGKGIKFRPNPSLQTYTTGEDGQEYKSSLVECKSADNPTSLLGAGLDLLIIDECSRVSKDVFTIYLYSTTINKPNCRRFFISTPFGKNWFYDEWVKAKQKGGAFQFKTSDNPTIENIDQVIKDAQERLPADVFAQEILAAFNDAASSVFRGVRDCIDTRLKDGKEPLRDHRYIMGVDLAKFRDFTVLTTIDRDTHEVVHFDRFHKISYPLQKERIYKAAKKYNSKIIFDALNSGASVTDDFRAMGLHIQDFKAVGTISPDWDKKGSKELMINKLSSFIQEKNVKLPPNDILIDELESYGYEMSDSGNYKYSAPQGLHDDCVASLGLAVWILEGKVRKELNKIQRSMIPQTKKRFQYL